MTNYVALTLLNPQPEDNMDAVLAFTNAVSELNKVNITEDMSVITATVPDINHLTIVDIFLNSEWHDLDRTMLITQTNLGMPDIIRPLRPATPKQCDQLLCQAAGVLDDIINSIDNFIAYPEASSATKESYISYLQNEWMVPHSLTALYLAIQCEHYSDRAAYLTDAASYFDESVAHLEKLITVTDMVDYIGRRLAMCEGVSLPKRDKQAKHKGANANLRSVDRSTSTFCYRFGNAYL